MNMVANDPMRNHSVPRRWDIKEYEDTLTQSVCDLDADGSPIETVRDLLPEIAKQNSIYTFGEFDGIRPASGTDLGTKVNPDNWKQNSSETVIGPTPKAPRT